MSTSCHLGGCPTLHMTKIGASASPLVKLVPEFQAMDLARQINEGTPYPIKALFCMGLNAQDVP